MSTPYVSAYVQKGVEQQRQLTDALQQSPRGRLHIEGQGSEKAGPGAKVVADVCRHADGRFGITFDAVITGVVVAALAHVCDSASLFSIVPHRSLHPPDACVIVPSPPAGVGTAVAVHVRWRRRCCAHITSLTVPFQQPDACAIVPSPPASVATAVAVYLRWRGYPFCPNFLLLFPSLA